jgi:phosphoribosyl-ATP pyrophosphohydrolase
MNSLPSIFARLMQTIVERKNNPSEKSYTTKLMSKGIGYTGQKLVEEAAEVWEAASRADTDGTKDLTYEAADLVYHLFVMLARHGVTLEDLEQELAGRFGISGLEAKAAQSIADTGK